MKRKWRLISGYTFLTCAVLIWIIGILIGANFTIHSMGTLIIANIWFASIK